MDSVLLLLYEAASYLPDDHVSKQQYNPADSRSLRCSGRITLYSYKPHSATVDLAFSTYRPGTGSPGLLGFALEFLTELACLLVCLRGEERTNVRMCHDTDLKSPSLRRVRMAV
jgi:hypothetical protein